ncbi:hypothetical protein BGZ99_010207 [Dissophora globulifera]|uniref:Uncharacterized protein n=1 Tax=Dissophora globulifera TaxID=979702 RepID=A0A9P6R2M2_9FUNG|nr:hypothetical protein BGZ99_010207 [Dissophora globulifera]
MSDQAELLRKRREARQKKILASGESRLSKITGTTGSSAQVAPSPAVLQAREELLKKEQEEERTKALRAAGGEPGTTGSPRISHQLDDEDEELIMPSSPSQRAAATKMARRTSSTSGATTATATATATSTTTTSRTTTSTTHDPSDADPDDSLGAPPAYTSSHRSSSGGSSGSSSMRQNPFLNAQHQNALARMTGDEPGFGDSSSRAAAMQQQQNPFGNAPPGFTVITPQVDLTTRWWKLLHLVLSVLFGFGVVYTEYKRQGDLDRFDALATEKPLPYGVYQVARIPVFWYFITMELILQSTRMFLHGVTATPSSTLGTIAGFLPSPFSDAIQIFMRYRLIWSSLVSDLSVVVFIVGLTITFTHMFS